MELREAILSRRTIRHYNDKPINKEEIIELLNDAVYAPTHQYRQTWRFIYIEGEEKDKVLAHMDQIYEGLDPIEWKLEYRKTTIAEATAILVVVNEKEHPDPIWMLEEYGAASALIQNFQLLAFERGIGVSWKSHFFLGEQGKFLGIQEHEMIAGVLTLGYFDEAPKAVQRIKAEDKFTLFKFDEELI